MDRVSECLHSEDPNALANAVAALPPVEIPEHAPAVLLQVRSNGCTRLDCCRSNGVFHTCKTTLFNCSVSAGAAS
jgi:hypothetical protein